MPDISFLLRCIVFRGVLHFLSHIIPLLGTKLPGFAAKPYSNQNKQPLKACILFRDFRVFAVRKYSTFNELKSVQDPYAGRRGPLSGMTGAREQGEGRRFSG